MANILIACEFSGRVRDAFLKRGHSAMSCDLMPTLAPGPHYQGDMFDLDFSEYDLILAFPPCTAVCISGNRYYAGTQARLDGLAFIRRIWEIPVERLCIENPVGVINTMMPDMPKPQYIQPYQFGHYEAKKTGLWKRGLPDLVPTRIIEDYRRKIQMYPDSKYRAYKRSITYQGIANAMAEQFGDYVEQEIRNAA